MEGGIAWKTEVASEYYHRNAVILGKESEREGGTGLRESLLCADVGAFKGTVMQLEMRQLLGKVKLKDCVVMAGIVQRLGS